ncbi:MAG: MFS transporter [Stackebrandtia sp.]
MFRQARQPFRYAPFRTVWSGETLSMLGDRGFDVAFIWLVLEVTGSVGALASVLLVQAIPRGVLLLVGGAVTDRLSPRTVMFWSHVVRGIAIAVLGVLAVMDGVQVWHFYVLGVVVGISEAFFVPATGSILPSLLPREHLERGNALVGFGEQATRLAGPILGGVMVASVGAGTTILLNCVTFFAAAATVFAAPRRQPRENDPTTLRVIGGQIAEGLRYARRSHEVRTVLMLVGAAALSYSGLFSVGLPALSKTFPQGSVALGILLSAWGLGQLVGTGLAVLTGLPRRWGVLIIGMTLCEGAAFMMLGFLPAVWMAATVLALLGIGVAYSMDVALPTFIQTRTAPEVLGRISSVMELPRMIFEPISIAAMGLLISVDLRWGFAMAALPMLAVGIRLALDPMARRLSTK